MNNIPQTLRERLRANKVIPFLGAGVSMSVLNKDTGKPLFPSWLQLLQRSADRLDAEQRTPYANTVRGQLQHDDLDYLETARTARKGLKGGNWFDFLKEQFDRPCEEVKEESLNLAQAIWKLGSPLIITTNYDRVPYWAAPQYADPSLWDIEAPAEQLAFLRDGKLTPTVWHLHGHIRNAANIILTHDGYKLLYPEASEQQSEIKYKAALQTLRSLLASHTFLFIGFSFDDAYFGMQLEGISRIYQGADGPHFVLVREADKARGLHLGDSVQAISFSDFGEPLLELVQELGEIANAKPESIDAQDSLPAKENSAPRGADFDPRKPYFSVPYRQKGDQVIGRESALQAVRHQLTKGHSTAIGQTASFRGLGGLGKTQLAVEYAYLYKDDYPNGVFWLNADQDIDAQLTDLAEKASWIAPQSEHKYKLEIAQQRLRSYSDCLIIFDNLEDLEKIKNYLPEPQAKPHILVTNRYDQPGFVQIPLDILNESDSRDLLIQEAHREPQGDEESKAALEIAKSLGGLPLALELAGAYLHHRQEITFQQYFDLLSSNLKRALSGNLSSSFTKHETDLYSTLKVNEEVLQEDERLRDILDLLTWSGSAPMGESLMCALLDVQSPVELTNALGLGTSLRLLRKTPDTNSYAIHRLVSEVRREEIPLGERREWVNAICQRIGDWFQERKDEFTDLPEYEAEIDHLRAWQEHARYNAPMHASRLIWLQAYPSHHRGRYQEAKQQVEKALNFLNQEPERDRELLVDLLIDLSFCCFSLGEYPSALDNGTKSLAICQELHGEQHKDTATAQDMLSRVYIKLGENDKALDYAEKSYRSRLSLFGTKHRFTSSSLSTIGGAYSAQGKHSQALEYSKQALALDLENYGEQHPQTATSLNNIGIDYGNLTNYEESLKYSEKALRLRQELLGEQHPSTASSFGSIGVIYYEWNKYKHALEFINQALRLRRQLLGNHHPDTINSAISLAHTLCKLNRPLQAYQLLDEFLRKLPAEHPEYSWLKEKHAEVKNLCPGFLHTSSKQKKRKKNRR